VRSDSEARDSDRDNRGRTGARTRRGACAAGTIRVHRSPLTQGQRTRASSSAAAARALTSARARRRAQPGARIRAQARARTRNRPGYARTQTDSEARARCNRARAWYLHLPRPRRSPGAAGQPSPGMLLGPLAQLLPSTVGGGAQGRRPASAPRASEQNLRPAPRAPERPRPNGRAGSPSSRAATHPAQHSCIAGCAAQPE
jgi:hypothetical protein